MDVQPSDQDGRAGSNPAPRSKIYLGHAGDWLPKIPANSVGTIITGPPWWGRWTRTEAEPLIWGGKSLCEHAWNEQPYWKAPDGEMVDTGAFCPNCNAWRGHLAREPYPELYGEHLRILFRMAERVLLKDSVIWLTLGDSRDPDRRSRTWMGVPGKVIDALRSDGWIVHHEIIWERPNTRPYTRTHEFIYCLGRASSVPPRIMRSIWRLGTRNVQEHKFEGLPDSLIEQCIQLSVLPPGSVVLDPFAGSGNVLSVAEKMGHYGLGIEIAPAYYKTALKRLGL